MKAAYVGIDFLYPALPALAEICEILKIFTCRTDNVTEFNTQVTAYARDHGVPLQTDFLAEDFGGLRGHFLLLFVCKSKHFCHNH